MTITAAIEVDWNSDTDFVDADEVITAQVKRARWKRGRDGILGPAPIGRLELLVDNDDRRYSPENASGPLYAFLGQTGLTVRVRTTAPVAKTHFVGAIDSIEPDPLLDQKVAIITAYEKSLTRLRDSGPIYSLMLENDEPGQAAGNVLEEVDWPVGERDLDAGTTLMDTWWAGGVDALSALSELVDEDLGYLWIKGDGTIRFEGRAYRATNASGAALSTFSDLPTAALRYENIAYDQRLGQTYDAFRAPAQRRALPAQYDVLWESKDLPFRITPGQVKEFIATWDNPAGDFTFTDFNRAANTSSDGSGTDMTQQVTWTLVESKATRALIRVTSNAAQTIYITVLNLGVKARQLSGRQTEAQVGTGNRKFPIQPRYIGDVNVAESWAGYAAIAYGGNPIPIVVIDLYNYDATMEAAMLNRDISDLIQIDNAELGLSSQKFWIESVEHEVTGPGALWKTRITASKVVSTKTYWLMEIAGFGEIEQTTRFFG